MNLHTKTTLAGRGQGTRQAMRVTVTSTTFPWHRTGWPHSNAQICTKPIAYLPPPRSSPATQNTKWQHTRVKSPRENPGNKQRHAKTYKAEKSNHFNIRIENMLTSTVERPIKHRKPNQTSKENVKSPEFAKEYPGPTLTHATFHFKIVETILESAHWVPFCPIQSSSYYRSDIFLPFPLRVTKGVRLLRPCSRYNSSRQQSAAKIVFCSLTVHPAMYVYSLFRG